MKITDKLSQLLEIEKLICEKETIRLGLKLLAKMYDFKIEYTKNSRANNSLYLISNKTITGNCINDCLYDINFCTTISRKISFDKSQIRDNAIFITF